MVGMTFPLAGQSGHGGTAFVRRQPVRIANGRVEGGYTDVFELICPGCGDNPYVDYAEITPRLQWLRGPRTLEAALEAYDKHLRPLASSNGGSAGSLGPGYMTAGSALGKTAGPHGGEYGVPRPSKGEAPGWARLARTGGWGTASVPPIS